MQAQKTGLEREEKYQRVADITTAHFPDGLIGLIFFCHHLFPNSPLCWCQRVSIYQISINIIDFLNFQTNIKFHTELIKKITEVEEQAALPGGKLTTYKDVAPDGI